MHRLIIFGLLAGCVPTEFVFSPTQKYVTPKPETCKVEVVTSPPSRDYQEVGTLEFYNGTEPKTLADFKDAVTKQVCGVGGDVVVAAADDKGQYTKGTVLAYTDTGAPSHQIPSPPGVKPKEHKEPPKPEQEQDSEIPKAR